MSAHAEFWMAIMDPDQGKRIAAANKWLADYMTTLTDRIHVDPMVADREQVATVWAHAIDRSKTAMGREIVGRISKTTEPNWSIGRTSQYRDVQCNVFLGDIPRPFQIPWAKSWAR